MLKQKGRMAALLLAGILFSSAAAETTLKLNGNTIAKYAGDFLSNHPNVVFDTAYTDFSSTNELTEALTLGSFDCDLFMLSNDTVDFRAVMSEGCCLDLSASELLQSAVQRLHPTIAQQCVMDGRIYAIPHILQLNYLTISPAVLEKAGMSDEPLPATYSELLDFLERWIAHLKANPECEIALLGMAYWGDASFYTASSYTAFLVQQLLENDRMQKAFSGESLFFDKEEWVPLLERSRRIGRELYQYDRAVQCVDSILKIGSPSVPFDDAEFLSLRLCDTQPHLLSVYVTLYAVNAKTQHPELCIGLMEALCRHNWPLYNTLLYQDSEPLADPQNGGQALVSPEKLEKFRTYANSFFVQMPELSPMQERIYRELAVSFAKGQFSAEQLVEKLNQAAADMP